MCIPVMQWCRKWEGKKGRRPPNKKSGRANISALNKYIYIYNYSILSLNPTSSTIFKWINKMWVY